MHLAKRQPRRRGKVRRSHHAVQYRSRAAATPPFPRRRRGSPASFRGLRTKPKRVPTRKGRSRPYGAWMPKSPVHRRFRGGGVARVAVCRSRTPFAVCPPMRAEGEPLGPVGSDRRRRPPVQCPQAPLWSLCGHMAARRRVRRIVESVGSRPSAIEPTPSPAETHWSVDCEFGTGRAIWRGNRYCCAWSSPVQRVFEITSMPKRDTVMTRAPATAHITALRVENFRALRNVHFQLLTPLTVLLGPERERIVNGLRRFRLPVRVLRIRLAPSLGPPRSGERT